VGSDDTRTNGGRSGAGEASNVVRIPRDWFGPKDELVPFGPRAREGPEAEGAMAADPDSAEAEAFDANLFWGEDAGAVHDVLETPAERVAAGRRRAGPIAATALAGVIAAVGIAFALLGGSPRRSLPRPDALASHADVAPSPRGVLRLTARAAPLRRRVAAHIKNGHAGEGSSTPVLFRSDENPPPTRVSYSASRTSTASAVGSSPSPSPTPATAASTPTATQSSQPAFGSSGALGPMSSPDG
jgi:hypothetical protein